MTKAQIKLIIQTYQDNRTEHGVRISIARTAEALEFDRAAVCEVLGFDPIRFLTQDQ